MEITKEQLREVFGHQEELNRREIELDRREAELARQRTGRRNGSKPTIHSRRETNIPSDHSAYIHQEMIQNWTLSDRAVRVYGLLKAFEQGGIRKYGSRQTWITQVAIWQHLYAPRDLHGRPLLDPTTSDNTWRRRGKTIGKALRELQNAGYIELVHKGGKNNDPNRWRTINHWK